MYTTAVVGFALLAFAAGAEVIGNVAFTAAFSNDVTIDRGQTIVFPEVYTNHGSGYDNRTGVFTTTKGGLYVFHVHGVTVAGQEFQADIYKNNAYLVSAYGRQNNQRVSGGNSVALRLFKGDTVVVKASRTSQFYSRRDEIYATFTGYLICILTANQ